MHMVEEIAGAAKPTGISLSPFDHALRPDLSPMRLLRTMPAPRGKAVLWCCRWIESGQSGWSKV